MIKLEGITKSFRDGERDVEILKSTDLTINKGEFVAIVGPSGSGKSTLLTIIGALQKPTSGTLSINDSDVYELKETMRSNLRFESMGFVLQGSNLVPYLTVKEQFELKTQQAKLQDRHKAIDKVLKRLSIETLHNKYPDEISGGERQRVAIGLALVLNPKILLADEPTASLDTDKAYDVVRTLQSISKDNDTTVIMVTHDKRMLEYCDRIFEMSDGVLKEL